MADSLLEMAKDLVAAQIQAGSVSPDQVAELLSTTHQTLISLQATEASQAELGTRAGPSAPSQRGWRKSITKHAVTCLECGATFRQLSARHLRVHDLDGRSYREKYGIPRTQHLSAQDVLTRRREVVNAVKPWEKSPTHQKAPAKAPAKKRPAAKKTAPKKAPKKATAKRSV